MTLTCNDEIDLRRVETRSRMKSSHTRTIRRSRELEPTVATSKQPERASAERSSKGQTLVIQDNVQRVVGALAPLARNGDIDQAQTSAAERWYRDYVMGVIGARDPEAKRSGKAPDLHASMLARAAAVTRCRAVRNGLGLCGELRLRLLLIDELSFSSIANRLFPGDVNGRKKIAAQMAFLLEQLAELYLALDKRPNRDVLVGPERAASR